MTFHVVRPYCMLCLQIAKLDVRSQSGDCRWKTSTYSRVYVGTCGLTYSLYHPQGSTFTVELWNGLHALWKCSTTIVYNIHTIILTFLLLTNISSAHGQDQNWRMHTLHRLNQYEECVLCIQGYTLSTSFVYHAHNYITLSHIASELPIEQLCQYFMPQLSLLI